MTESSTPPSVSPRLARVLYAICAVVNFGCLFSLAYVFRGGRITALAVVATLLNALLLLLNLTLAAEAHALVIDSYAGGGVDGGDEPE